MKDFSSSFEFESCMYSVEIPQPNGPMYSSSLRVFKHEYIGFDRRDPTHWQAVVGVEDFGKRLGYQLIEPGVVSEAVILRKALSGFGCRRARLRWGTGGWEG
jgi:hypothetical protein